MQVIKFSMTQHITNSIDEIVNGHTYEATQADIKQLLGNRYNPHFSPDKNVTEAIRLGYFPKHSVVLSGFNFELDSCDSRIYMGQNITLRKSSVSTGTIEFRSGELTSVNSGASVLAYEGAVAYSSAQGAMAYANGGKAIANADGAIAVSGYGGEAFAEASGAVAKAGYKGIAWANAPGTKAFAVDFESKAYANASDTKAYISDEYSWFSSESIDYVAPHSHEAYALKEGAQAYSNGRGKAYATARGAIAFEVKTDFYHYCAAEASNGGRIVSYAEYCLIETYLDILNDDKASYTEKANAAFQLGMQYSHGNNVKQSDTKATFFLRRAHELGHPEAMYQRGNAYMDRSMIRVQKNKAMQCYSEAVKLGHKGAELDLQRLEAGVVKPREAVNSAFAHFNLL